MIDFKKNIICENKKEYLFIKKIIIENGFEYDDFENYITFPGFFRRYDYNPNKFTFLSHFVYDFTDNNHFITAKQIIRELKLEKINK